MESHLKNRPKKHIFSKKRLQIIKEKAIKKIKSRFLQDDNIIKIILIGSSIKGSFGKYDPPGFRGSLYSDFDFIVFVEDDYIIPEWLEKEPDGKPFPKDKLNLAFRNRRFIEDKYDLEIFFIKRKNMQDKKIQKLGELAGIPMTEDSRHKHIIIYSK
jgi:hypothetical protein